MSSFLQFIASNTSTIPEGWIQNAAAEYRALPILAKAHFVLEQSVLVNYLNRLYDSGPPNVITDLIRTIMKDYLYDVTFAYENEKNEALLTQLKEIVPHIHALLNFDKSRIYSKEILALLQRDKDNESYPHCFDISFYTPYLRFLDSTTLQPNYVDDEQVINSVSFSIGNVSLPGFSYSGQILSVSYECTFASYSYAYKAIHQFIKDALIPLDSVLTYWYGYNWTGDTFTGVTGVFAAQCLELDANAIPTQSAMWGYRDIYLKVVSNSNLSKLQQMAQSSSLNLHRRRILAFLIELRKRYNVTFDNKELLAKFLVTEDEDAQKLHAFLQNTNVEANASAAKVSVEVYHAFKRSPFGKFEELDIASTTNFQNKKKTEAEEDDDPDTEQDDSESEDTPPKKKKAKDEGTASPEDEGTEGAGADDAETDSGQDPESDDDSQASASSDTPDDEPSTTDDSETKDDAGSSDTTNTHTTIVQEIPKLSDKRGVKLTLSTGESTDTVLYKLELESFVDTLLTNPPKSLSVQTITALKVVRSRWLHLLSAQSAYDVISRIIKVPKEIKPQKPTTEG